MTDKTLKLPFPTGPGLHKLRGETFVIPAMLPVPKLPDDKLCLGGVGQQIPKGVILGGQDFIDVSQGRRFVGHGPVFVAQGVGFQFQLRPKVDSYGLESSWANHLSRLLDLAS